MSGMLRMLRHQVSYIFEQQAPADLNDDGNFRNSVNVSNVMTVIKCHTFSETQARAGLNDDGNFRNGWNVRNVGNVGYVNNVEYFRTDIKCHTFSEPQP